MKIVGITPGIIALYGRCPALIFLMAAPLPTAVPCFVCLRHGMSAQHRRNKSAGIIDVLRKRIAKAGIKNANVVVIQPPPIRGIGMAAGFSMQIEARQLNR